jgi:hypothetical protein
LLRGSLFRRLAAKKQFSAATKPFSALAQNDGNAGWLSRPQRQRRTAPGMATGDSQMRTLGFFLAFVFVLAGQSIAGSTDGHLPGVGTFAYTGSPIGPAASHDMVVAAR